jgi:hypothetical protein
MHSFFMLISIGHRGCGNCQPLYSPPRERKVMQRLAPTPVMSMALDVLAGKNKKFFGFDSIVYLLEVFLTPRKSHRVKRFTKLPLGVSIDGQIVAGSIIGDREYVGVAILKEIHDHC